MVMGRMGLRGKVVIHMLVVAEGSTHQTDRAHDRTVHHVVSVDASSSNHWTVIGRHVVVSNCSVALVSPLIRIHGEMGWRRDNGSMVSTAHAHGW